jgi:hypothetical protein
MDWCGMTQMVEHLLCKSEVLSSNPSPTHTHKNPSKLQIWILLSLIDIYETPPHLTNLTVISWRLPADIRTKDSHSLHHCLAWWKSESVWWRRKTNKWKAYRSKRKK